MPFTPKFVDMVRCTTTSTGTGAVNLGPAVAGYSSFNAMLSVGDQYYYCIQGVDRLAEREVGRGTLQSGGKMGREAITGGLTDFSSGTKTVALVAAAEWFDKLEQAGADGIAKAASRALLAAAATSTPVYLTEAGREGVFVFDSANQSAMVTADPLQAVYVAPSSDTDGSSGAWVRQFEDRLDVEWFGGQEIPLASRTVVANYPNTDIQPALAAFQVLAKAAHDAGLRAHNRLRLKGRAYYSSKMEWTFPVDIEGNAATDQGLRATWLCGPVNQHLFVVNRHNTYNGGTVASSTYMGADGSRFANILFLGASGRMTASNWYEATGASISGSAIWFRARGFVEDCSTAFFGGHGFYVYAFAGAGEGAEGNANACRFNRVTSAYNGGFGFWFQGSDANAIRTHDCVAAANRLGGLADLSFLGGGSHEIETEYNGVLDLTGSGRKTGNRAYLGKLYVVRYGQEAGAATNAPSGTTADNTWWLYVNSTPSSTPAWSSGEAVECSADILTAFSTAKMPIYAYQEGNSFGSSQIARGTMILGSATGLPMFGEGDSLGSDSGVRGIVSKSISSIAVNGDFTQLGDRADATVRQRWGYNTGNSQLQMVNGGTTSFYFAFPGQGGLQTWTTPNHATHPNSVIPNKFALPLWPNNNSYRRIGYINAIGDLDGQALDRGDLFFYASPASGGRIGVSCTTAGTAGSGAVLTEFGDVGPRPVTTQAGTGYTAVLADADSYIRFTNAAAIAFTIPPNASVAFPIGTEIDGIQAGAGALTLVAGAGVTLNAPGGDLTLAGQYAAFTAKKIATNAWDVVGKF